MGDDCETMEEITVDVDTATSDDSSNDFEELPPFPRSHTS